MNGRWEAWVELAACANVDAEVFFPTAEFGPVYERQVAAAKEVCAGCPVQLQCLVYARTALPYGIAGGLTEEERRSWATANAPSVQLRGDSPASARAGTSVSSTAGDMEGESAVSRRRARPSSAQVRAEQVP